MNKLIFLLLTFSIFLSCNRTERNINEQNNVPESEKLISTSFEDSNNNDNIQNEIIVYKFHSNKIIRNENVNHFQLPNNSSNLRIINGNIFEYNYSSVFSENSNYNRQNVDIIDNNENPFYKHLGDMGGGHTYIYFYYFNDYIIMRFDYEQTDMGAFFAREEGNENIIVNKEILIFDTIFLMEGNVDMNIIFNEISYDFSEPVNIYSFLLENYKE